MSHESEIKRWDALRHAGRVVPNNDPDRFDAVTAAMGADVWPVIRLSEGGNGVQAALVARSVSRKLASRVAYLTAHTPALRCLEVVYGGVLSDGSSAARAWLVEEMIRELRTGSHHAVVIHRLAATDPIVSDLRARWRPSRVTMAPHLVLQFGKTFDDTMKVMSAKERSNTRRKGKLLEKRFPDLVMRTYSKAEEVAEFGASASELTKRGYQGELAVGFRGLPAQVAAMQCDARNGRWLAYGLFGEGRLLSYECGCLYGNVFFGEATAFDPEFRALSPGTVLLWRVVADLQTRGVSAFDFGYGEAVYKRSMTNFADEEATVVLLGSSVRPSIAKALFATTSLLNGVVEIARPLAQRVRTQWRKRLEAGKLKPEGSRDAS